MAPRTIYANLVDGLQPFSLWDQSLADMGSLGIIPCTAVGTNAIVLTPVAAANAPAPSYANNNQFLFISAGASTGLVTVNISGLGAKNVYKSDGVTQVGSGDIFSGRPYEIVYSQSLDTGGGFYLKSEATSAADLTFIQTGTGAVTRSLSGKVGEIVSVKDFGAAGNGITDDTSANSAAVTALAASGSGTIYYGPGSYKINNVVRRGGWRYIDSTFPTNFKEQARSAIRTDTIAANGEGTTGVQALSINGTLASSTVTNFLATVTPDVVAVSAWGFRGNQVGGVGSNPIVVGNFGAWFENNVAVTWATEIDVNNEGATQTEGSDTGGVGIALNTGSTFSPDTALWVRRFTGAGTAPGFLRGVVLEGVRNTGFRAVAMSPTTYPGLSPAAPGSLNAYQAMVSGDAQVRYNVTESGVVSWGPGNAGLDVTLSRTNVGELTFSGSVRAGQFGIAGATSGFTTLISAAVASGVLTFPAATDTIVARATTDTLTNKTFDTAGAGNVFKINGTQITANTGSGSNVLATSPTITTPTIATSLTFSPTTGGIVGTTTNDNTSAGNVGEYVPASVASGSAVALTTGTAANVTSISLTAGDWDVESSVYFSVTSTTSVTQVQSSISTTSATIDTGAGNWHSLVQPATVPGATAIAAYTSVVPRRRISLSSTTTVFLVAFSNFTVSTNAAWGLISARRVR